MILKIDHTNGSMVASFRGGGAGGEKTKSLTPSAPRASGQGHRVFVTISMINDYRRVVKQFFELLLQHKCIIKFGSKFPSKNG